MGHKDQLYEKILMKTPVNQDSRSQSLPNCSSDEKTKLNGDANSVDCCDTTLQKLLTDHDNSPPHSPSPELWFKTWPERCDKVKSNDSSPIGSPSNKTKERKSQTSENCDKMPNINGLTLNEALKNISLAYSPVTKQLHLVEEQKTARLSEVDADEVDHVYLTKEDTENEQKKLGHRRIQTGSYSSTVSSLSDPSPSGSLLDPEERSLENFEISSGTKPKKKIFTNLFNRNVFNWKNVDAEISNVGSVWKLFAKSSPENGTKSPQHVVSSSALIQHPRPSNLPAKTQEEEQRHREEYKAILAAARKKEALDTLTKQRQQKQQLQQEEHQATVTKHFLQNVLPNWEVMKCNKKTREYWWQGLPSSVRGKVWHLAIGNELNVSQQLYEICLSRAQNRLRSPESIEDNSIDQEQSLDMIQLDISRTFPHLCIFQEGGPYSEILHSLLAAYVCYRPDVGYVQGMSYIAAILILNMEQYPAFICFANLLNQPLHLSAFTLDQIKMQAYYQAYNEVFSYNLPKLYAHFQQTGLTPDLYLLDWIYTIYAKAMPLDVACRIWDVFLRDGYEFIFRTALGILNLHQDILFAMDFLHGAQFLTRLPEDLSSDQLFKSIQNVSTSIGKQTFSQIVDKCSTNLKCDNCS